MPVARFLVDVSAWVRYPVPAVGARLDELSATGVVASCGLIELDLLGALPDAGTYTAVAELRRRAFELLDMSEADVRRALEIQALLAAGGQRVGWKALVVAAVAERHGVVVLHYDTSFDLTAKVTGQAVEWVVLEGTAG